MTEHSYSWYKINPFSSSVAEKYDEQKDIDLQMLCHNISDVLFVVFKLPKTGLTLCLRVPTSYRSMVESITSFGFEYCEFPIVTNIDAFVKLKLAKNFVYPLVSDETAITSNIFSVLSDSPYGVFGIKLRHAPSKPVTKRYEVLQNKKKKRNNDGNGSSNTIHIDPYEKMAKQKSECTSFFYSEMFFGIKNIFDITKFMKVIPYTAQHVEPNHLIRGKIVTSTKKNFDAATDYLKKTVMVQCNNKNMILSDYDILPFVRFPENSQILGLDSAKSPTMASDSFAEREFKDIGGFSVK